MGAYELPQKPAAGRPKVVKKATTSAVFKVKVKVNAEGTATKVHLVAAHGHLSVTSGTVSVPPAATPKTVRLTLRHLSGHTKHTVRAVAKNSSGHVTSAKVTLTTRKHK